MDDKRDREKAESEKENETKTTARTGIGTQLVLIMGNAYDFFLLPIMIRDISFQESYR